MLRGDQRSDTKGEVVNSSTPFFLMILAGGQTFDSLELLNFDLRKQSKDLFQDFSFQRTPRVLHVSNEICRCLDRHREPDDEHQACMQVS